MSLVVRVIAPTGRDAELISAVLQQNQVAAQPVGPLSVLSNPDDDPIGPLLIAEEALSPSLSQQLHSLVENQQSWSDLPILVLTGSVREDRRGRRLDQHLPPGAVLLERPIRPASLLSSVQAALRARMRQFEIRDAVHRLKEERETLQAVLDHLPIGVALARSSGEIVLRNRRLTQMIPLAENETMVPSWRILQADGQPTVLKDLPLRRAMQTGQAVAPEDYLYESDAGTRTWISVAAAPIFNDAGSVTGGVVAVSDIQHQKRAELALIQNEKLAAVGRLAASISHEINNPLESVTNLLYLARHSGTLPDEVRTYLETADSELARVSQIVSHTLRFHRQSTKPRTLSVEELLTPTIGLYTGRLHNSGIRLTVAHRGTGLVTCYEGEIRQVLHNLVGNALDSMRTGGQLTVLTRDTRLWKSGVPAVRITIADTGHGMSPLVAQRVFEAFYTTKGINGTGLGLWIARGIVEKHSGLLQVRSSTRPEKSGTVFSLVLPHRAFIEEANL